MNKVRFFPIFLIIIGFAILSNNLGWISNVWSIFWPLIFILLGTVMIVNSIECDKK